MVSQYNHSFASGAMISASTAATVSQGRDHPQLIPVFLVRLDNTVTRRLHTCAENAPLATTKSTRACLTAYNVLRDPTVPTHPVNLCSVLTVHIALMEACSQCIVPTIYWSMIARLRWVSCTCVCMCVRVCVFVCVCVCMWLVDIAVCVPVCLWGFTVHYG